MVGDRAVIENVVAGADVPTGIAIGEEAAPTAGSSDEEPDEDGEKEKIGQRGRAQLPQQVGQPPVGNIDQTGPQV